MKDWKKIRSEWLTAKEAVVGGDGLVNVQALWQLVSEHFEDALDELAGPQTPIEKWRQEARLMSARAGHLPSSENVMKNDCDTVARVEVSGEAPCTYHVEKP